MSPRNALATVLRLPASGLILCIRLYQATLSFDHGPLKAFFPYGFCRHHPTCSQYGIDVLRTRSLPVALWLIVKRVASCNPWHATSDERLQAAVKTHMQRQ